MGRESRRDAKRHSDRTKVEAAKPKLGDSEAQVPEVTRSGCAALLEETTDTNR